MIYCVSQDAFENKEGTVPSDTRMPASIVTVPGKGGIGSPSFPESCFARKRVPEVQCHVLSILPLSPVFVLFQSSHTVI